MCHFIQTSCLFCCKPIQHLVTFRLFIKLSSLSFLVIAFSLFAPSMQSKHLGGKWHNCVLRKYAPDRLQSDSCICYYNMIYLWFCLMSLVQLKDVILIFFFPTYLLLKVDKLWKKKTFPVVLVYLSVQCALLCVSEDGLFLFFQHYMFFYCVINMQFLWWFP